jgi:hypothetical protein
VLGRHITPRLNKLFNASAHRVKGNVHHLERTRSHAFALADKPKQQMLGADQERVCAAVMQLLRGYDVVPPAQLPAVPTQVEVEGEQRLSGITLILPPGVYDTFMERIEPLDPAGPEYRLVLARLLEAQARRQRRLAASLS